MWRDIAYTNSEAIQAALFALEQRLAHIARTAHSRAARRVDKANQFRKDSSRKKSEKANTMTMTVQEQFGQIDIYVFDQILRGNLAPACVCSTPDALRTQPRPSAARGVRSLCTRCGRRRREHVRQLSASLATGLQRGISKSAHRTDAFPDEFADVVIAALSCTLPETLALSGHVEGLWRCCDQRDAVLQVGFANRHGFRIRTPQYLCGWRRVRVVPGR